MRDFFELAMLANAPIAKEVVRPIDELSAIERDINGEPSDERRAQRRELSKPLETSAAFSLYQQTACNVVSDGFVGHLPVYADFFYDSDGNRQF